jgi:hypothetical protein
MCRHDKIVYLGKQKVSEQSENFLYLFNCEKCKTTISLRTRKDRRYSH